MCIHKPTFLPRLADRLLHVREVAPVAEGAREARAALRDVWAGQCMVGVQAGAFLDLLGAVSEHALVCVLAAARADEVDAHLGAVQRLLGSCLELLQAQVRVSSLGVRGGPGTQRRLALAFARLGGCVGWGGRRIGATRWGRCQRVLSSLHRSREALGWCRGWHQFSLSLLLLLLLLHHVLMLHLCALVLCVIHLQLEALLLDCPALPILHGLY
jgi:hypothetical protein